MDLRIERSVPFFRDDVYAWWTDFREEDHRGRGSPARSRREILRRAGNDVWLRDRATRPAPVTIEERVVLDPPNGYSVEARYPGADVRYEYRFDASDEGARIVLTAKVRPRGLGRLFFPFLRPFLIRYAERDTDFHVRQMAEDLSHPGADPARPR